MVILVAPKRMLKVRPGGLTPRDDTTFLFHPNKVTVSKLRNLVPDLCFSSTKLIVQFESKFCSHCFH